MVRNVHVSYKSSLRVYEPIFAFEGAARTRWARYAARRRNGAPLERERRAMLRAVVGAQLDFGRLDVEEEALVADWRDNTVVCPLDTRDRALQAIVDSEWKLPYPLSDQVLGRTVRRQAAGLQLRPKPAGAGAKDHVQTASWEVPFWWSLMFTPSDAVPTDDLESVVYRTSITDATRRAEHALELISKTFGVTPFISDLDVAVRWVRTFDLDSMIELDYGSLGGLVQRLDRTADDSMSQAADAVEFLQEGDLDAALASYRAYVSTWEDVARLEGWN